MNEEDISSLQQMASSSDPEVRGRVALALGKIEVEQAFTTLLQLLGDSDNRVRITAVHSLGEQGNAHAVEALLPLLEENSVELTCEVMAALAQLGAGGNQRAFAPIVARLFDVDDDVRRNAAAAIGPLRDERALEPLLICLNDSVAWVRANAALSLGQLESEDAQDALVNLADSEDEDFVRANAVCGLGAISLRQQDADMLDYLLSIADDIGESPQVRVAALLVFAQNFEQAIQIDQSCAAQAFELSQMLVSNCEDDDLRSSAVWAVGQMCNSYAAQNLGLSAEALSNVRQLLQQASLDPYEWCARYAAEALENLPEE